MKQRKLAFVIILGLISFGLYDLYWLSVTRKEMLAKGQTIIALWKVFVYPLLLVVAAIALSIAGSAKQSTGFTAGFAILLVAAMVAWIVLGIRFLKQYCQAADTLTNHDLAYLYSFWMGILLYLFRVGFIWEAIVQYHFNRIGVTPASAGNVAQAAPVPPLAPNQTQPASMNGPNIVSPQPSPISPQPVLIQPQAAPVHSSPAPIANDQPPSAPGA
jgi:hypothetical protein